LGQNNSLWFCLTAYTLATYIGYMHLGWIPAILGLVYLSMVIYAMNKPDQSFWVYKKFPIVNTVFGMIIFFLLVFKFL
ncbi:MAG: hypothetical protein ACI88L_000374, partial [Candidatus Paceibacteria bacterium]